MKRRLFLGGAAALSLTTPALASTRPLSLSEISRYLNGLKNAKGPFTQVNPDGTLSEGTLYVKLPGRMRFEYTAPNDTLVIVSPSRIAIFDKRSNAGPQQYPLRKTPLHTILKKNVNLNESGVVTAHQHDGTYTSITTKNPENSGFGNLELMFTEKPTQLRQWIVTNESGQKTTITLGKLSTKVEIPGRLFDIDRIAKENETR